MRIVTKKRKRSEIAEEASALRKYLNRQLKSKEWGQLTSLKRRWGKEKLDNAIRCFIKCDKPDKEKYMIPYLGAVCRNESILSGEIKSAGSLEEILSQDRSIDNFD